MTSQNSSLDVSSKFVIVFQEPNRGINPDEAIAYGAAIQAGILGGHDETNKLLVVIGTNCIGSCKSNYHTITATTAPHIYLRV
jgi:molecular chaperone DnaK (HSP70)